MEINKVYILLFALLLDSAFGDPRWMPHLIVLFGNAISRGEKLLNKGNGRFLKGLLLVTLLVVPAYLLPALLLDWLYEINPLIADIVAIILLFYCLANRTLIKEGKAVFDTLKMKGVVAGRKRLSRIVGRDTSKLNGQQIRTATLETLSENLSDGVIAPLFYFFLFGVPGAIAYKMINTFDSMIGYKSDRYRSFGKFAAKLDDIANFIPARTTAFLMLITNLRFQGFRFVFHEGKKHASPNAGYPEAALAYILNCQFGGPNFYGGKLVDKPYIGGNPRTIHHSDLKTAIYVNWASTIFFCMLYGFIIYWVYGGIH